MTREALLKCWLAGAPLMALGELLGESDGAVEEALRMELNRIAAEHSRQNGPEASATVRKPRQKPKPKPARSVQPEDLSRYPEALRDPRSRLKRRVWDALSDVPKRPADIAAAAGTTPGSADVTLRELRHLGLAATDGSVPARWVRRQS